MTARLLLRVSCLLLTLVIAAVGEDPGAAAAAPQFTTDNRLNFPENYREWIYLSSGLGMTYGGDANGEPQFTNVFVEAASYRRFVATGAWPDKTMFILEKRRSATNANPNLAGHFQTDIEGYAAAVKDEARFPGKWAYFGFSLAAGKVAAPAKAFAQDRCWSCHSKNAAVDNTFVQFYPSLKPIAKLHGTYSEEKATGEAKPPAK